MNLFIMRHGESMQNAGLNKDCQYIDARIPLTEKGKEQVRKSCDKFVEYIKEHNLKIDNDIIKGLYSPYDRTLITASIFELWLKDMYNYKMELKEHILLTEQQWGLFDSVPKSEWNDISKPGADAYFRARQQEGKFWSKPFEGESPFDVYNRVGDLVKELNDSKEENLILFTHGTTGRCLIMRLLGETTQWYEKTHNPKNASIWLLRKEEDGKWIDEGYIT